MEWMTLESWEIELLIIFHLIIFSTIIAERWWAEKMETFSIFQFFCYMGIICCWYRLVPRIIQGNTTEILSSALLLTLLSFTIFNRFDSWWNRFEVKLRKLSTS